MFTFNAYYTDFNNLQNIIFAHRQLFNSARKNSILVQVFSGVCNKSYLESLRAEIRSLLPDAIIIGTTTMGEIMNGEVSSLKTAVSFSIFDSTELIPILETRGSATCFELGESIAEKAKLANAGALILFSTLQERDAEEMLRGITAKNETIIVAGGCSGNNMETENGLVISDAGVSECSIVGAALSGERLNVKQYWHLCWTPVGKSMTVTKADRTRVYTIDGLPAFQIYRKHLGLTDRKSSVLSLIFPLLMNRHGVDVVQAPVTVNDDDSIDFRGDLKEGEKIRFSYGHIGMIVDSIDSLIEAIKPQPVDGIFVYSCGWRRAFLQDSTEIETRPLQNLAPTAGFFTNGEFYHISGANHLLTGTMTTLAVSETLENDSDRPRRKETGSAEATIKASTRTDNLSLKGSEIIKTLTQLVESTTLELNEKIVELEEMNNKVWFDSMHDSLSGLYNRNFYEEEVARVDRTTGSVGILIGDLDGLKLTNDTLGHGEGDELIRDASKILSVLRAENRTVFRVGGDEFVIIETGGTREGLDALSSGIVSRMRSLNETSDLLSLSISIGTAFTDSAFGRMQDLFAEADGKMYECKLRRSKEAKEDLAGKLIARWRDSTFRSARERDDTRKLAAAFARHLKLDAKTDQSIASLAEYHDIGEIGVSSALYEKRDVITAKEKTAIERHAEIGFRIAHASRELLPAADLILKHHERWDGKGYPLGIKEERIPLECRAMSLVTAYTAMTNERPYRKALGSQEALKEIVTRAGADFDPNLAGAFVDMLGGIPSDSEEQTAR